MRPLLRAVTFVSILLAAAQIGFAAEVGKADTKYFTDKAQGLMTEIQLGTMADKQSQDERVREFGRLMVSDHGKDLQNLKQLAAQKNVSLPAAPKDEQQQEINKLSKLSGKAFDKEYIKYEIKDHKKDAKEDRKYVKKTADPDMKKFAAASYETVSGHLRQANEIAKGL